MRFIIVTMGSEGDVRPYIALARELQQHDHEVLIATSDNHFKVINDFGIGCIPIRRYFRNPPALLTSRFVRTLTSTIVNEKGYLEELWKIGQKADVLIYNVATFPCLYIAEKLSIPAIGAFMQPHHPTTAFPDPSITDGKPLGGIFNLVGFWFFDLLHWLYIRKSVNRWRKKTLQLPAISILETVLKQMKKRQACILYPCSAFLLPKPPDWSSDRLQVTGYWFLDTLQHYDPPPDLDHFLNTGPPPVFISVMWNIDKFSKEILLEIARSLDCRLIIHDLYGEMEEITSTGQLFYVKGSIPHEWLFKRIAMAVHHGGLGISMNCIRAGVPMVNIPSDAGGNDHRFWAYQIARSGVGIHLADSKGDKRFVPRLVAAIKTIMDGTTIQQAIKEMSQKVKDENGLQTAMKIIIQEVDNHAGMKNLTHDPSHTSPTRSFAN